MAAILWSCREEDAFGPSPPAAPPTVEASSSDHGRLPEMDRAALLLPVFEVANPRSFDLSSAGLAWTGGAVLRSLAALLIGAEPAAEPIHHYLASRLGLDERDAELTRRLLVLSADHGFEPATYAVRAVAANGVTPWRSVMTGLLVSMGRRSTVGRHEAVQRLLTEIQSGPDPTTPILRRLRDGEAIPGFGPGLYGPTDPRAEAMLQALSTAIAGEPELLRLQQVLAMVHETQGLNPSFSLISLFSNRRLGLSDERSLFPLARAVGWIAHANEQYQLGEAEHQEGRYLGPLPRLASPPLAS